MADAKEPRRAWRDRNPSDPDSTAPATTAIVASARRIDLADRQATIKAMGKRQDWQEDAWVAFDAIGEIKFVDTFLANAVSRLRLFAASQPDAAQPPIPVEDDPSLSAQVKAAAIDALARIRSEEGGQAAIAKALALNLEVAGECWLIAYAAVEQIIAVDGSTVTEASDERWEVRSVSEVQTSSEGTVQTRSAPMGPNAQWVALPPSARLWRVWEKHPRWSDLPDCALHGVLSECDELMILSRAIRAEARSRLPAGIFTVPTELSFGPLDPTSDEAEDPFAVQLMDAMMRPVADEGDPAALVPLVIRGKAEHLHPDKLRHITFDRPIDQVAAAQREELLTRIAQGLNAPVELMKGKSGLSGLGGGNVALSIDNETFTSHIEPRAIGICDALTTGPWRPLVAEYPGVDAAQVAKVFIWYDETAVVTQANRGEDAKAAHEAFVISDAALRGALGFADTDAPDAEELARRATLKRGTTDPAITEQILGYLLGQRFINDVETIRDAQQPDAMPAPGTPPIALPSPSSPPVDVNVPEGVAAALVAAARLNPGTRLARIDADLFTRLRIAADDAMTRAMEKAGARLRSKAARVAAARNAVGSVENELVAATLGPAMVASLEATEEELLEGAFDRFHGQFDSWVGTAQAAALTVAFSAFGLADDRRADVMREQTTARDEAWTWIHGALVALARTRLYDPSSVTAASRTTATLIGEVDPTLSIPASMIREAMARAGGTAGLAVQRTGAGGVRITTQAGTLPAGGVATGQTVIGLAAEAGFPVDWYEWQHGAPAHPFEPHLQLDGVTFYGEDDPNVANDEGWPPDPYYFPGDHDGCTCQSVPVFGAGPDRTSEDLIG